MFCRYRSLDVEGLNKIELVVILWTKKKKTHTHTAQAVSTNENIQWTLTDVICERYYNFLTLFEMLYGCQL